MTLTYYVHPLSSYCQKALIALYDRGVAFEPHHLDLQDPAVREAFTKLWPVSKMPVLTDDSKGLTLPEASLIIEYIDALDGRPTLVPAGLDAALEVRLWDRVFDNYVMTPMGRIVSDTFRAEADRDPVGVAMAKGQLTTIYGILNDRLAGRVWVAGDAFSMADCAAAPSLFYARSLVPFGEGNSHLAAYFERLIARPSIARVLEEAKPWFHLYPMQDQLEARFR